MLNADEALIETTNEARKNNKDLLFRRASLVVVQPRGYLTVRYRTVRFALVALLIWRSKP